MDIGSLEKQCALIIEGYRNLGLKIATAESCTGGLLSAALTQVAGSSDVFERGFVTYSYPSKTELLGVSSETLREVGAVSQEVAKAMAVGALVASNADIAVSITGVAGPGASESKPEGLVWFGYAERDGTTKTVEKQFGPLGRDKVRHASVIQGLDLLTHRMNIDLHLK